MLLPTDLLGEWRLDRRIEDRRTGETLLVDGTTSLAAVDGGVRWTEAGVLHRPSGETPVSRSLLLTPEEQGGWFVRFADGRPFHAWRPDEPVEHDCAPDRYRGLVTGDATAWQVVWEARGPTKDYRMESRLSGAAAIHRSR